MQQMDSGSGTAGQVAGAATEESKHLASTAAEETKHVASTAASGTQQVLDTTKEQAGEVANAAKEEARNLVHESRVQLKDQAQNQTSQIAQKLREIGDEVRALADGRPEDAANVRSYAQQAADKLGDYAGHIDRRGFDGVVDDVKSFARRRPGAFLLGCAVAGFAAGRLVRNTSGSESTPTEATGQGIATVPPPMPAVAPPMVAGTATPAVSERQPRPLVADPIAPNDPTVTTDLPPVDSEVW